MCCGVLGDPFDEVEHRLGQLGGVRVALGEDVCPVPVAVEEQQFGRRRRPLVQLAGVIGSTIGVLIAGDEQHRAGDPGDIGLLEGVAAKPQGAGQPDHSVQVCVRLLGSVQRCHGPDARTRDDHLLGAAGSQVVRAAEHVQPDLALTSPPFVRQRLQPA